VRAREERRLERLLVNSSRQRASASREARSGFRVSKRTRMPLQSGVFQLELHVEVIFERRLVRFSLAGESGSNVQVCRFLSVLRCLNVGGKASLSGRLSKSRSLNGLLNQSM